MAFGEDGAPLPLNERRRLITSMDLSELTARLFVERGVAATTVQNIAETGGVSVRTFYRYFASKSDALMPFMRAGLSRYVERVRVAPAGGSLVEHLCNAIDEDLQSQNQALNTAVVRLVVVTPELHSVWLGAHEECAVALAPVLAARLGPTADPVRIRYASASIVTATRLAVEAWIDGGGPPCEYVERCLKLLSDGVLSVTD